MKFIAIISCFLFSYVTLTANATAVTAEPTVVETAETAKGEQVYKINLQSAMDLAVEHSYALKAAQASKNSAQYTSNGAYRALAPNLSGSASNIWQNTSMDSTAFNSTEKNLTSQGTLTLSQPLLGLIPLSHTVEQKNIALKISQTLENASKNQAALLGAQYYLNLQLALAQLSIANANLTTLQKSKQDAETLFQTGSIYKDDYLRILLQYTQAQQGVVSAQSGYDVAKFSLAQSLGLKNPELVQVEPQSVSYWESKKFNIPDLEVSKQIALKHNQNIQAAEENIKLAEVNKTLSEDNYLPSLNAVVNYNKNLNSYDYQNSPTHPENTLSYGFQLTWNIWDWGVRAAQNSALTEQIANEKYQSEEEKETILNNVVSQYYTIENNVNAVKTAITSVATASEAFDLVSFRFLNGQVTALDLVTAQQNLTTSKADLAQARFNLDLAWLTFQTVLGKSPSI